ncbi:MAG: 5'/3'-nucleotidase SurE [Rhodospirillales bacterium]|jgi:5'-nucleotidase|nr:5'/3'-nucleotidase SurE [Rhodospirillaceae bacterium]MDP6428258.1 5'/3'-nucleotidase SurE [Rhodospirillales bacterium]MDP6646123.1 5'/3'-nucleotidase SurE [Rhodospirillales bacterium]MDP6840672.1 5'/3'-nucleotidase SurE [Rhodospirillales bacterium]
MFKAPLKLSSARILISNDDGIGAPGLKRLEKIARGLAAEVWVVAPEEEQSSTGHSLTLRRPLRIRKVSARRFAVDGTPTDCILLAVNQIMKDSRPNLVLSGINRGSNLGEDMTYSGTIAAAMEATLLGVPAIALSQRVPYEILSSGGAVDWSAAESYAARVVRRVTRIAWPRDVLINVNFPPLPAGEVTGIEVTREGRRKVGDEILEGRDPRGEPYYWIGNQKMSATYARGTDLAAVAEGKVSVTPLSLDLTQRPMIRALKGLFAPAKGGGKK